MFRGCHAEFSGGAALSVLVVPGWLDGAALHCHALEYVHALLPPLPPLLPTIASRAYVTHAYCTIAQGAGTPQTAVKGSVWRRGLTCVRSSLGVSLKGQGNPTSIELNRDGKASVRRASSRQRLPRLARAHNSSAQVSIRPSMSALECQSVVQSSRGVVLAPALMVGWVMVWIA